MVGAKPLHPPLIRAAVATAYASGISLEEAQIHCLLALNKICASSGPKTLQRIISEHNIQLIGTRPDPELTIAGPPSSHEIHVAVPESLLRQCSDWLFRGDTEERRCGEALYRLTPR